MDDDGSKHISLAEFKKAMTELSVGLTERDARLLFDSFDEVRIRFDQSNFICSTCITF